VLLAALAIHTSHIGLVLTAPALYGDPVTLAREIASLDHFSKGRGAWNIITSQHQHSLKILGLDAELARSAKYGTGAAAGHRTPALHRPAAGTARTEDRRGAGPDRELGGRVRGQGRAHRRGRVPSIYKQQVIGGYEVHGTQPPLGVYF
jgi:hypothetical protein